MYTQMYSYTRTLMQEYAKEVLARDMTTEQNVMKNVLLMAVDTGVRAMAPFAPFLSEELYQRLPRLPRIQRPESVCIAPYPQPSQVSRCPV